MSMLISSGLLLGLSAGFAPGPLLALIISETLEHGIPYGIRVAIAPLITDLPLVLISIFVVSEVANFDVILGIISLMGASYISYLGYKSWITQGMQLSTKAIKPQSLKKGVIANLLSPTPYIFWFTVGAPIVIKAAEQHVSQSLIFISIFYILMVGIKMGLAVVVGKSRHFLSGKLYLFIMRFLAVLLFLFALILLKDALILLS